MQKIKQAKTTAAQLMQGKLSTTVQELSFAMIGVGTSFGIDDCTSHRAYTYTLQTNQRNCEVFRVSKQGFLNLPFLQEENEALKLYKTRHEQGLADQLSLAIMKRRDCKLSLESEIGARQSSFQMPQRLGLKVDKCASSLSAQRRMRSLLLRETQKSRQEEQAPIVPSLNLSDYKLKSAGVADCSNALQSINASFADDYRASDRQSTHDY